jgi:polysaccharide export outer membrane protein
MKKFFRFIAACALVLSATSVGAAEVALGRGDVLRITVFGSPELSLETKVAESGNISYPLLGEVAVQGLAPADAERKIAKALETGGFVRHPQVSIFVTSYQSQQISVLGQVNRPGRYPVDGPRTLIDMLALAGGISAEGSDSAYLIRTRDGKTIKEIVDLSDMMHAADLQSNVELQGGDIIYVERAPRFYIYGEVQRPGVYRLEKHMTVIQALSAGGGLNARGTERGVRIKRMNAKGQLEILAANHGDVLQADDVVYVNESLF